MLQKLFSLVDQTSVLDNPDSLQNHEVLPAGQLMAIYVKVGTSYLVIINTKLIKEVKDKSIGRTSSLVDGYSFVVVG